MNNLPSIVQYMDIEAAIIRNIYGLEIYGYEEITNSDFHSDKPYAYKIQNKDIWKLIYPHGSLHITPSRSLDGAYFTAMQTLKNLYKRGFSECKFTVTTDSRYHNMSLSVSFLVTFMAKSVNLGDFNNRDHSFSCVKMMDSLELAFAVSSLEACGYSVDQINWTISKKEDQK